METVTVNLMDERAGKEGNLCCYLKEFTKIDP